MKIAAVCCTYLRPKQLGRILYCFSRQVYPDRELIILDDAGQYESQQGDRWRLVSTDRRYATLGEKRNAAVALAGHDVGALAVWDDDDGYLPWALSACVAALETAPWSRPSLVLLPRSDGSLKQHRTGGLFHGGWAYATETFRSVGGYPAIDNGEDQAFALRMKAADTLEADPVALGYRPFYVYSWGSDNPLSVDEEPGHLSGMGTAGYRRLGKMRSKRDAIRAVPPPVDFDDPKILPGIHSRPF